MTKSSGGGGRGGRGNGGNKGSGKRNNVWVTPGFEVKREGVSKPVSSHRKQAPAVRSANREADKTGGEVIIQRAQGAQKGQIREKNSHGHDPFPPKG